MGVGGVCISRGRYRSAPGSAAPTDPSCGEDCALCSKFCSSPPASRPTPVTRSAWSPRRAASCTSSSHSGFELSEPKLRRAGLDYHDLASVTVHPDLATAWDAIAPARVYAFTAHATTLFADVAYEPGDVLMFGPEPTGLDDADSGRPAHHLTGAHPDAGGQAVTEPVQRRGGRRVRGVAPARLHGCRLITTRSSARTALRAGAWPG